MGVSSNYKKKNQQLKNMFKSICIKPNDSNNPTDIGFIAENMLYYQNVNVIASPDTLPILLNNCGIDILIELLTNRNLNIFIRENILGVMEKTINGKRFTDVVLLHSESLDKEEVIFRGLYETTGRRGYSKRITQRLIDHVDTIKYQENICDLVRDDINDTNYFKQSIIEKIKYYNPDLTLRPEEIEYTFNKSENGYNFTTNLNYEAINKEIPNSHKNRIDPSGFLLDVMETRGDMHLALDLNAEIATTNINTILMKLKFQDIYNKTHKISDNLFQFNDFTLSNGHAIQEIINNGDKSFSDFITVLDKAEKFRDWLSGIEDNKNILQEYHSAVISETWVDKLPTKALRWSFFTGVGFILDLVATGGIGTLIGLGISVGDALLLDKIIKGWKPNVFIEKELKPFIK